jgi:sodium-coupled neutral amino acid transporter 11
MTHEAKHGGGEDWQEDRRGLLSDHDYGQGGIADDAKFENGDAGGLQPPPAAARSVRFNETPQVMRMPNGSADNNRRSNDSDDMGGMLHMDDPMDDGHDDHGHHRDSHRRPLLTDMEAPSVAVANDWDDEDADQDSGAAVEAQMRRPKSGLKAAFMNMANSIIGAGIIGQPYAMRQAGLLAGVLLLVGLTIVVDWTICLIVINSKLSGTSSFQGTVEHCFGRAGLIAISVAQWVFAFGGMVAFGVIVGDTIPHVLVAIWPDLASVPVLGLLTDRRVVIAVFCLGVSYPLTLYRDIAKLAKASTFALIGMMVIVTTVLVQGLLVSKEDRGSFSMPLLTVNNGIFQAIGVISFGKSGPCLLFDRRKC